MAVWLIVLIGCIDCHLCVCLLGYLIVSFVVVCDFGLWLMLLWLIGFGNGFGLWLWLVLVCGLVGWCHAA